MTISMTIICICLLIVFLIIGIVYFFITLSRFFDHRGYSAFESSFIVILCIIAAVHMFKIGTEYNLVETCEASLERDKFCEIEKTAVIKDADS